MQIAAPSISMSSVKTWAIITIVILVLLIGIAWYFYSQGAKKTSIAPLVQDNPGSTNPNNNPAGVSDADIKTISDNLYNEMSGANFGHDAAPYEALMALSDTDFERVYNQFNTDYQSSTGETLTQWILDQWSLPDSNFDGLKAAYTQRAEKLNLI